MRQLRIAATLAVAVLVSCVATACTLVHVRPASRAYYLTKTPHTFSDSTADAVIVHLDDRLQVWLDGIMTLGRKERLEQAACLRVAKVNGTEVWADSILKAYVIVGTATPIHVAFDCGKNTIPIHWHVLERRDDGFDCIPSDDDTSPSWAGYPAEMLDCGMGPDSLVAWRTKYRPPKPLRKAKL